MRATVKERVDIAPFEGHTETPGRPAISASPKARQSAAWLILMAAALGFVAAGCYTVARGWDARNQVGAQLAAEHITTAADSALPNRPVVDGPTAKVEADVIRTHMLKATGGKTYAQLDREDPLRTVAFQGSMLRTSLLSATLAWNVASLAIGFGAFVAGVGLLLASALMLLRPKLRTV